MISTLLPGDTVLVRDLNLPQPGDVIAFKAGDIIITHRLIARLPYPFHNWGLQRGDAHQLGSWIDLRCVIGKVVHPEVSEPISGLGQAAEIACHLAWGAASRAKRLVMRVAGPVMGNHTQQETTTDDPGTSLPSETPLTRGPDDPVTSFPPVARSCAARPAAIGGSPSLSTKGIDAPARASTRLKSRTRAKALPQ
ncbi:S24/S26 family peptidase [Myxococcota bacterium]|nr:S24/S26 family peptidase [Myxococcota bacterium]